MTMGSVTKTDVAIMYINGVCDPKTVKEVKKRMAGIEIDSILESGYIEQFIEDAVFTTFPTVYHTERPDMVAGICLKEGSPSLLTVHRLSCLSLPFLFNFFNLLRITIHVLTLRRSSAFYAC